jgi:hypothetical protein
MLWVNPFPNPFDELQKPLVALPQKHYSLRVSTVELLKHVEALSARER